MANQVEWIVPRLQSRLKTFGTKRVPNYDGRQEHELVDASSASQCLLQSGRK